MIRISGFILLILIFCSPVLAQLDHPDLLRVSHQSKVLNREQSYYIYIPSTDDPDERFPVLYMLHGKSQDAEAWPKYANAANAGDDYRSIMVFVGGAKFSWYIDSPLAEDSQFLTYVTEELVDHIDSTYRTISAREARGIMGLSMGGHGALLAAAKRPDLYGSASSLSGVLKMTDHGHADGMTERLGSLEEFPDRWAEISVYENADAFIDGNVRLLFDCENDPDRGLLQQNIKLHEKLTELGVPHIWRRFPGGHNWRYWRPHLQEHLNFHNAVFSSAQEQKKWTQHYFERLSIFLQENAEREISASKKNHIVVSLFGSSGIEGVQEELLPEKTADGRTYKFVNRGISSDRLGIDERGLSKRMESSVFDFSPAAVVIANGTNDIGELHRSEDGHPSIERMIEEYEKIVQTIRKRQPETAIVIAACVPTRDRFSHLNDSISEYNHQTNIIAEKYNCVFVDVHQPFVDEEGNLKEVYSRDGLHITDEAKKIWIEMIGNGIEEALASN